MGRRLPRHFDGPALGLLLLAWGAVLVRDVAGPIVLPDELVGIGIARHLFGRAAIPDLGVPAMPGMALLLAPFASWLDDPERALTLARALNVLLFASLGPLAIACMRTLAPDADRRWTFLAASCATLYPPLMLHAHVAMTEAPMAAGVTAVAWLLARTVSGARQRSAALTGLLLGFLPVLHVRGTVPAAAGAVVLALWASTDRSHRSAAGCALVAAATALGLGLALQGYVAANRPAPWPEIAAHHAVPGALARVGSTRGVGRLAGVAGAQSLYLLAATLGIAWIGIAAGVSAAAAAVRRRALEGAQAARAFAAFSQLGTLLVASLFANGFDRAGPAHAESFFVGRAHDAVALPTLLVGLAAMGAGGGRSPRWVRIGILAAFSLGCGALFAWRTGAELSPHGINWINLLGIHAVASRLGRADPRLLVTVAALGGGTLVWLHGRHPRFALVAVSLWFALSAGVTSRRYFADGSRYHEEHRALIHAAKIARQGNPSETPLCIAVERVPRLEFTYFDVAFHEPSIELARFDAAREPAPCTGAALLREPPPGSWPAGARRIAIENDGGSSLWAMPGPLLDTLGRLGELLPEPPDAPLVPDAMRSRLRLDPASASPIVVSGTGHPRLLAVTVEHVGTGAPWPNGPSLRGSGHPVRVGSRWLRPDGTTQLEGRSDLPRTLFPGETAEVEVLLPPPRTNTASLPPGRYRVRLGLLEEGVRWFADAGDATVELDVTVE